jgi:hypothetical protein
LIVLTIFVPKHITYYASEWCSCFGITRWCFL